MNCSVSNELQIEARKVMLLNEWTFSLVKGWIVTTGESDKRRSSWHKCLLLAEWSWDTADSHVILWPLKRKLGRFSQSEINRQTWPVHASRLDLKAATASKRANTHWDSECAVDIAVYATSTRSLLWQNIRVGGPVDDRATSTIQPFFEVRHCFKSAAALKATGERLDNVDSRV